MNRLYWTALLLAALSGSANAFPARGAPADETRRGAHWLLDEHTQCWVWDADAAFGDSIAWSGSCSRGRAEGNGTLTLLNNDRFVEQLTGPFADGKLADGSVSIIWSDGSRYQGGQKNGAFDGHGELVDADGTRRHGEWKDDSFVGPEQAAAIAAQPQETATSGRVSEPVPAMPPAPERVTASPDRGQEEGQQTQTPPAEESAASAAKPVWPFLTGSEAELIAVDGSVLSFRVEEGGSLERTLKRPDGSVSTSVLQLLGDHIGTLADDEENVVATFRIAHGVLAIDYDDGHGETLAPNPSGGVLETTALAGAKLMETRWFPEGHAFTREEREDALKQYAVRLDVAAPVGASRIAVADHENGMDSQPAPKPAVHVAARKHVKHPKARAASAGPPPALRSALVDTPTLQHAAPLAPADQHADVAPASAIGKPDAVTVPPITTVAVRASDVHLIDAPEPDPSTVNASQCLNVESNGMHWGFRNSCETDVQFAYCVVNGPDALTQCGAAVAPGSVAAHGFSALIADLSLKDTKANHSFRWIGCAGGAGEVVPRLESSDPPFGRCLHDADLRGDQRSAQK